MILTRFCLFGFCENRGAFFSKCSASGLKSLMNGAVVAGPDLRKQAACHSLPKAATSRCPPYHSGVAKGSIFLAYAAGADDLAVSGLKQHERVLARFGGQKSKRDLQSVPSTGPRRERVSLPRNAGGPQKLEEVRKQILSPSLPLGSCHAASSAVRSPSVSFS